MNVIFSTKSKNVTLAPKACAIEDGFMVVLPAVVLEKDERNNRTEYSAQLFWLRWAVSLTVKVSRVSNPIKA